MSKHIKIKKGLTINLPGEAERVIKDLPLGETFAVKPDNFIDVLPKLLVKEGDDVQAGTPLFYDKNNPSVKFCSPVSGEIAEIARGEKRKIEAIRILADRDIEYIKFGKKEPQALGRKEVADAILEAGLWPAIRQRPYGIIPNPEDVPKSIFISAFDSNPLAPDYNFIIAGKDEDFQSGIDALAKLTSGAVHITVHSQHKASEVFSHATNVQHHQISGPHPAGNVGVQIHHIDPVNKGQAVWFVNPQDVVMIGRLFNSGIMDASKIIAVTGSQVLQPKYYKTVCGTAVKNILHDAGIREGDNRIISGNVLTGSKISIEGYLNYYDAQITVIPEGHEPEFLGWIAPGFSKFSMSHAFFSWLTPNKKFNLNTNLHGEERPFVMTGQYEQVFPMDIYPVQLLKAALIEDIELMENLGIYEVLEEDFALCEFVCTSKIESQDIIRKALSLVRKEMG